MATTTKKTTKKTAKSKAEKPKKLSKAGQWMRDHPNRGDDVIITDPRILDGLSIYEILD
jgi:hypothetical protein